MADQWYFERDGAPAGPVSFDEMQRLARTGVLARESRVWSEGMSDWVAAGSVERIWSAPAAQHSFDAPAMPVAAASPAPVHAQPVYHQPAAPLAAEVGLRTPSYGVAMGPDVEGMVGDMRFVGIFTLIYGAFTCLGIITAIIGVPVIIMGLRLREAAEQFERYARAGDTQALSAALERQAKYFRIQKIFLLISLAFMALYFIVIFFVIGTAGIAGLSGM
jgi:hypothetical protein